MVLLLALMLAMTACISGAAAENSGFLGTPYRDFTVTDTVISCSKLTALDISATSIQWHSISCCVSSAVSRISTSDSA